MRSNLWSYFLLSYALTWSFTIPFVIPWHTVLDRTFSPRVLYWIGILSSWVLAVALLGRLGRRGTASGRALDREP